MKTIDATKVSTLSDLLDLAEDEPILVTTPDGRELIVAEIDDFDQEIEAISHNRELMELLEERSKERAKGRLLAGGGQASLGAGLDIAIRGSHRRSRVAALRGRVISDGSRPSAAAVASSASLSRGRNAFAIVQYT